MHFYAHDPEIQKWVIQKPLRQFRLCYVEEKTLFKCHDDLVDMETLVIRGVICNLHRRCIQQCIKVCSFCLEVVDNECYIQLAITEKQIFQERTAFPKNRLGSCSDCFASLSLSRK